ncbi:M23 family metallopeptidase [Oceanibium sediminis]|uniref:M23 family metallopeptidase n=1 Tax=Oceanibium sediminis TaxID=2026339 RepID=UPI000DD494B5|nr:M23 family metallopeptidase [Oceanibium sediminis]
MTQRFRFHARPALAVALALSLSACGDGPGPLSAMFGGDKPAEGAAPTLPRPQPDSRGVITYATSQVILARRGDSLQSMGERVGLSGDEIAVHNGVPLTYTPRSGEVFALPRDVGGTPVTASSLFGETSSGGIATSGLSTGAITTGAIETAPRGTAVNPFQNGQPDKVIDPIRHRVEAGETAFSIARLYGVSVTALASWNGLDGNMTVRQNQELLIPVINGANSLPRTAAANAPGTTTDITPPPSASAPLPANQDLSPVAVPASPNLGAERTAASAPKPEPAPTPAPVASQLARPVAGASVLNPYKPGVKNGNEGIDFAAAAGTPVVAAEAGEIALISKSLGGLGTIVLVRHAGNLMTVYGRITDVSLQKGDRVSRGQKLGVIAEGKTPNLHFEVRQGTTAVDPGPYLNL